MTWARGNSPSGFYCGRIRCEVGNGAWQAGLQVFDSVPVLIDETTCRMTAEFSYIVHSD